MIGAHLPFPLWKEDLEGRVGLGVPRKEGGLAGLVWRVCWRRCTLERHIRVADGLWIGDETQIRRRKSLPTTQAVVAVPSDLRSRADSRR